MKICIFRFLSGIQEPHKDTDYHSDEAVNDGTAVEDVKQEDGNRT